MSLTERPPGVDDPDPPSEADVQAMDNLKTKFGEIQAELDAAWAKRRAKETEELSAQEAANYERHHAVDKKAGIGPGINEE